MDFDQNQIVSYYSLIIIFSIPSYAALVLPGRCPDCRKQQFCGQAAVRKATGKETDEYGRSRIEIEREEKISGTP